MPRIRKIQLIPANPVTLLTLRSEHAQQRAPDAPRRQTFQRRITPHEKLRHETMSFIDLRPDLFQPSNRQSVQCKDFLAQQKLCMNRLPGHHAPGIRPITFFRSHSSHSNAGVFSASTSARTVFKPTLILPHGIRYGADSIWRLSIKLAIAFPKRLLKRFISVLTPNSIYATRGGLPGSTSRTIPSTRPIRRFERSSICLSRQSRIRSISYLRRSVKESRPQPARTPG